MNFKLKKKGAIEIQFNWIFVLVAGAIILLFFVSLSQRASNISKIKIADDVLDQLSLAVSGAKVSTGTANLIETPKLGFEFSCDASSCNQFGCTSAYTVQKLGIEGRQTKLHPLFAPSIVRGNYLLTWTIDWNMPYRIGNFVYITSPEVKYYLVANDNVAGSKDFILVMNKTLPDREIVVEGENPKTLFNKEIINAREMKNIVYQNNYKTRFIFYKGGDYILHSSFKGADVSYLNIVPEKEGIDGYGKLEFSKPNTAKKEEYYAGKALLLGAVFAEDADFYECNVKKSLLAYNLVGKIYLEKTRILHNYYCTGAGIAGACQNHNSECQYFAYYKNTYDKLKETNYQYSSSSMKNIYQKAFDAEGLEVVNQNLLKTSCPVIY